MIDPSSKGHLPVENDETQRYIGMESASQCMDREGRDGDPPGRSKINGGCVPIIEESSSNLEVASSPLGEVKLSLSLNSAIGRPDF